MAIGTVTISEENYGTVKKIQFNWTSAANGVASDTTTNAYTGEVIRLVTVPNGNNAPTDAYDVALNDADGTDVLMGAGANRANNATEQVLSSNLGCVANDKLTLMVTNAGNATKGNAYVYLR